MINVEAHAAHYRMASLIIRIYKEFFLIEIKVIFLGIWPFCIMDAVFDTQVKNASAVSIVV